MLDLLSLVGQDTQLRRVATTKGGEWAGPCPLCGGADRLRVWPSHPGGRGGQWWCRGCQRGGDAIAYQVERGQLTPADAGRLRRGGGSDPTLGGPVIPTAAGPQPPPKLAPPGPEWQAAAREFVALSAAELWRPAGGRALAWLRGRGLEDSTIRAAGLGYNAQDQHQDRAKWGLEAGNRIWLPRGIVIPWVIGGDLWRVNIRRPAGEPKYIGPAGWANALYNADALASGKPAVLVEGEIDALSLAQAAGDLAAPVATGSTQGSRRPRWIAALALCPAVLVAYDTDQAGEEAGAWWLGVLANAKRWRPLWADANAMLQDGADLAGWVAAGLGPADKLSVTTAACPPAPEAAEPAPAAGGGSESMEPAPPWVGAVVELADLADFKARWGLQTVGGGWAEGEPRPVLIMREAR